MMFSLILAIPRDGFDPDTADVSRSSAATGISVLCGSLILEMFRYLYLRVYINGEEQVKGLCHANESPFSDLSSALALGLGFGITYSLLMYGGVLEASLEPQDYFHDSCPNISMFIISAFNALMFQVLSVSISVIMMKAMRHSKWQRIWRLVVGVLLHVTTASLSILNTAGYCGAGMSFVCLVVLASVPITKYIV